jgi:hypothetical protein
LAKVGVISEKGRAISDPAPWLHDSL